MKNVEWNFFPESVQRVIQFARKSLSLDFKSNHILQNSCLMLWTWIDFKISDYVKGSSSMQHLSLFDVDGRDDEEEFRVPSTHCGASTNSRKFRNIFRIISYRLSWHILPRNGKWRNQYAMSIFTSSSSAWHFWPSVNLSDAWLRRNVNYLKPHPLTCSQVFGSIFMVRDRLKGKGLEE